MKTVFASLAASVAAMTSLAHADPVTLDSHVDNVTIFPASATVHRIGRVHLTAGEHQVVFPALPSALVDDTIRISGFGQGATAEGVTVRPGRRIEVTGIAVARMEAEVGVLTQRVGSLTARQAELARAQAQIPHDVHERERVLGLQNEVADVQRHLVDATAELATRQQTLAQARADGQTPVKFVTVDVATAREGDLDLGIEYLMPSGAAWRAVYAAHLDAEGGRLALDMYATVQQSTGEDWNNVHLAVSTVVPSTGLELPTFAENGIELEDPPEPMRVMGLDALGMGGARGAGAIAPAMPASHVRAPRVAQEIPAAPLEEVHGDARPHLLAARLDIPNTVSIRSGAPPRRLLAAHSDLASTLEYQAAPRQSASVYLAAHVTNANPYPLLQGPVALFLGSDYVGSTTLHDVPIDEALLLPFGVDAGVTVDRTLAERHVAGRSGRDESSLRYQYRLTNHRARPIDVVVFEQLPVSHSQGLEVHTVTPERAPQAHHEGDPPGVIRWGIHSDAGATQRWTLQYAVTAPHRRGVVGSIE